MGVCVCGRGERVENRNSKEGWCHMGGIVGSVSWGNYYNQPSNWLQRPLPAVGPHPLFPFSFLFIYCFFTSSLFLIIPPAKITLCYFMQILIRILKTHVQLQRYIRHYKPYRLTCFLVRLFCSRKKSNVWCLIIHTSL